MNVTWLNSFSNQIKGTQLRLHAIKKVRLNKIRKGLNWAALFYDINMHMYTVTLAAKYNIIRFINKNLDLT